MYTVAHQSYLVLAPFAEVSVLLEARDYPTSNLVLPCMFGLLVATHWDNHVFDIIAVSKGADPIDSMIDPEDCLDCIRDSRIKLYEKHLAVWRVDLSEDLKRCLVFLLLPCLVLICLVLISLHRFYMICTMCDPRMKGGDWPGCSCEDLEEMRAFFRFVAPCFCLFYCAYLCDSVVRATRSCC